MSDYEKEEISRLPEKYRPIGAWTYFGLMLLFSIPVIGFICLLVYACSDSNVNKRSFARSYFCGLVLVLIVCAVILIIAASLGLLTRFIK